MHLVRIAALLVACCILANCTAVMDASTDTAIESDPGSRSFGTYWNDEQLESLLSVNLKKTGPGLADAHINITSFNSVVLLTGEVSSKELKKYAGETVRTYNSVRQVHNRLLVKNNSTLFSRTNDSWVATQVRSKLVTNSDVEAERVKVIVENRIVYLMGLLTHEEAKIASELAAITAGVEQVVRVIEYIEE